MAILVPGLIECHQTDSSWQSWVLICPEPLNSVIYDESQACLSAEVTHRYFLTFASQHFSVGSKLSLSYLVSFREHSSNCALCELAMLLKGSIVCAFKPLSRLPSVAFKLSCPPSNANAPNIAIQPIGKEVRAAQQIVLRSWYYSQQTECKASPWECLQPAILLMQ